MQNAVIYNVLHNVLHNVLQESAVIYNVLRNVPRQNLSVFEVFTACSGPAAECSIERDHLSTFSTPGPGRAGQRITKVCAFPQATLGLRAMLGAPTRPRDKISQPSSKLTGMNSPIPLPPFTPLHYNVDATHGRVGIQKISCPSPQAQHCYEGG